MRTFIVSILSLLCFVAFAQESPAEKEKNNPTALLKSFIEELANPNIAPDVIMSQYVLIAQPNDEIYDYLEARLEEIRINLLSKDIENIVYTTFQEVPRKETKDIDLEGLNADNIYFLYYNHKQLLGVYIKDNQIASVSLVSKGNNKAHFVLY